MIRAFLTVCTLTLLMFGNPMAHALQPAHQNYDGCDTCHNLHGSPFGFLLDGNGAQATCEACHGVGGVATEAANHTPPGYTIECRECHDAHEYVGTPNQKMIGYECDPVTTYGCDNGPAMTGTPPVIRVENATSDINNPVYVTVQFYNSATDFNIAGSAVGVCEVCHSGNHNEGQDCTSCHSHATGFQPSGCDSAGCHDGNGSGGLAVGPDSPHSSNTTPYGCSVCHGGHGSGTIIIPNNPDVGINYTADGRTGINLGSSSAPGDTEAEICWNCHDTNGDGILVEADGDISEWETNTNTNGNVRDYNFGTLPSTFYWTDGAVSGATWTSANFGYKIGALESTHSVNSANTSPGLDAYDTIRCSYCHDVHDTFGGPNDGNAPYLRGTWKGNPYREDGAPLSGFSYASQGAFGAVPRGGTGATELGGYQIDQNNGNPTSTWTVNDSAGLCMLCHTKDFNGDPVTVDDMNYFGNASDVWVGSNGHANAVLGGTGVSSANATNIFREDWRKPNDGYCDPSTGTDADGNSAGNDSYCAGYPNMANQQLNVVAAPWGGSFRGAPSLGDQGYRVEPVIGASQPFAYQDYNWGATVNIGTTDSQYHKFSCSKCHNPHASRLPRLMITNCLDVTHSTWDDDAVTVVASDSVTISGAAVGGKQGCDAAVNSTHTVVSINLATNSIFVQASSFSSSCSRQNVTLTWNGNGYSLSSVDFSDGAGPGGTDEIQLNADIDMQNFIGMQIPSSGTQNLAGLATVQTDNDGVMLPLATSAQNCHRFYDSNGGSADDAEQKGWNKVTPWQ